MGRARYGWSRSSDLQHRLESVKRDEPELRRMPSVRGEEESQLIQRRWSPDAGRLPAGDADPFQVCATGTAGELVLRGELDAYTAPGLSDFLAEMAVGDGPKRIVLDLRELRFIDVTGVGTLVSANNGAQRIGAELVLRSPTTQTRKLLEMTGLNQVFTIEDR